LLSDRQRCLSFSRKLTETVEAWVDAACADGAERGVAKTRMASAREVLEASAERAAAASRAVQNVEKNRTAAGKSGRRGRPPDELADHIVVFAANIYERRTGTTAYREISRDNKKPRGGFHNFLTRVFAALGLTSSPDSSNMRLQAKLREMRKSGSGR
jgi:hypothetical protein